MNAAQLQATLQTAVTHHQQGRLDEAERIYRQLRSSEPRLFDAWHLGGVAALQRGRLPEATELLVRALRLDPKSSIATTRYGLALALQGRHEEASRQYRGAIRLDQKNTDAWANLGTSLRALGQVNEAMEAYAKALQLRPNFPETLDLLGALIADTKGMQQALPYFQKSTELNPSSASAWCNLGLAQSHMRRYRDALQSLRRASELDPQATKPIVGRALVEQQTYALHQSAQSFAAAIAREPANEEAHSGYLLTQHYLGELSPAEMYAAHRNFGEAMERTAQVAVLPRRWMGERPLRVALLSPDFRRHAVAYFVLPLLKHVDRTRVEILLYHDHGITDEVSARLRQHAAIWRNFAGQAHSVVEKQIREDAPDVLIDLSGHTGVNRLALFARRLAPVQISYLGYPNTTGLRAMDYRFTDAYCDREGVADALHTERLVRFSSTAWAFQAPAELPPPLAAAGERPFTFSCFNNYAKVSDHTLRLWSAVLAGAPEARLTLKGHELDQPEFRPGIEERLVRHGIDPKRINFIGRIPGMAAHLECYQSVDASLDPYPYHGTTTTCESLLMGVPVVTRLGETHVSRVGGSLLRAVGHSEWIAEDDAGYVECALSLARAGARRTEQRVELRQDFETSVIMDHAGQAVRFWAAVMDCAR